MPDTIIIVMISFVSVAMGAVLGAVGRLSG
jgi:hypothetical protein